MFLHRKKELEVLNNGGSALIYGKRRVGKTSLIKEYLRNVNKPCYYFECLRASLEENMEYMISDMMRNGILKFNISFSNFYVVLEIEDAYVIYEVKYLSSKMSAAIVNKEIEQIKNIRGLNVSKIGFINPNGFEMKLDDVLYVESIYEL